MKNSTKFIGIFVLVIACSPGEKPRDLEDMYASGSDASASNNKFIKDEIENIFLGDVTPCDIPFMLEQTNVQFDPSLPNSLETPRADKFNDYELAMNLGIYTTDFGYLASFNRHEDAMVYLKHCNAMAHELGIATAFDMELIRNVENKIESPDALSRILRNEMHEITKYLKGDFRNEPAVLVIAGGIVEGLYISTELLSRNYQTDETCIPAILEVIHSQETSLQSTIQLMEALNTAETFDDYLNDFNYTLAALVRLDVENEDLQSNESWKEFTEAIRMLRRKIIVKDAFLLLQ